MVSRLKLFAPLALLFFSAFSASQASAQGEYLCATSDSATAVAPGLYDVLHLFGSDTVTYPHEFALATSYPVFNKVFDLWLSDGVSDRWSQSDFQTLISSILDNDSTLTDDIFGKDWYYFMRSGADANSYHAGVRFNPIGSTYTKIVLRLYDTADVPTPCPSGYGGACDGYSFYRGNTNEITINASPANSMDVVLKLGIAHELQHLCYRANGSVFDYESINETMSTLAEYLSDGWRPHYYDLPYDAAIMRYEKCDANSKYEIEKMWIVYLYEVFKGSPSDPTDDLIYRWIHTNTSVSTRMRLSGLATELWHDDYDWVGGVSATDRLNKVFANFLVAKFCNAPDFGDNGEYGLGPISTVDDFALFLDNCNWYESGATPLSPVDCPENPSPSSGHAGCWNVRILPPEYTLSSSVENTPALVTGIYEDGDAPGVAGDGSTDYIDVSFFGTDYVVFRAGSYYQDGEEHELEIRIEGNTEYNYGEDWRMTPIGWVIGYSANDAMLQEHPEHIVFIEPVTFSPATTLGTVTTARPVVVTDFGRSIKAVVLAISAVTTNNITVGGVNRFFYEYEYGVFTAGASTRTWEGDVYATGDVTVPAGGTLDIDPGTRIRLFDADLAEVGADTNRVEINVEGELIADGTEANPITFESWTPTATDDWVGFYFDDTSDGGTFDNCFISRAEIAIESHVLLTLTNTVIDSCAMGVASIAGGGLVQGCQFIGGENGIELDADAMVIRNTTIDGATINAVTVLADAPASLDIRNSIFMNSEIGLFVWGDAAVDVDSVCYFYNNETGIHFYDTGSAPIVRASVIGGNTNDAILCDQSSHPLIDANSIGFNGDGIYCSNGSSPIIKGNEIQASGFAITATSSANPDVGHASPTGGQSPGNNKIAHTGKYVVNNNSSGTIYAENNCWNKTTGSCLPASNMFTGSVDRDPSQCCEFDRWDDESIIEPEFTEGFVFQIPTGGPTEAPTARPTATGLVSIVPNPFNPTTTISYGLAAQSKVDIKIYDVAGRLVQELANGTQSAGPHSAVWTGTDRRGAQVASGVYFVRMVAAGKVFTKKMVMLK